MNAKTVKDVNVSSLSMLSIDELPGPKKAPLIGNFAQISPESFHSNLEQWAKEYGPAYQMKLLNKQYVVISDPKVGLEIIKQRPKLFNRTERLEWLFDDLGIHGVFSSNGDKWKRQRRLIMPAFSYRTLASFVPHLKSLSINLQTAIDKKIALGRQFNVHELLQHFTIDITTGLVFGYQTNMLSGNADTTLRDNIDLLFRALNKRGKYPFPWWRYIRTAESRRVDKAREDVYQLAVSMISKAKAELAENSVLADEPETILQAMIVASDSEEGKLTDDELFANILTLLLAGEDTTSNMLAWTLYYLAQNADLQKQVIDEVSRVCGDIEMLDLAALEQFDVIEAILREGLRLKGTAPLISAEPTEDTVLSNGIKLPKGTAIFVLTRPGGLDDKVVECPEQFNPERWLATSDKPVCPHLQSSHLPFGAGARHCPGERLAMMEGKAVIARLCWYYVINQPEQAPEVGEEFAFTMRPTNLALTLTPRQ
ncbi:cytochrome P450 [Moritella marina ATCC 15381]|uniref:Cytochrome P450 n=1 Tax=Moritella marina ATCC 15381 TaxID=1202962 RepID=A0A5J6WF63_MORMI|nr:cytochrome P450 [Moritella marina]QFI36519.1 cytochrome P450 [Moritella marina ATCC 15381]